MLKSIIHISVVIFAIWLGWTAKEWSLMSALDVEEAGTVFTPDIIALAPDNFKEVPVPEKARRSSPDFNRLLAARAFEEAVELYDEAVSRDELRAAQYHRSLLEYLRSLLASNDAAAMIALLDIYLSRYYDDIDVLLVLAEFQRLQGYVDEGARVFQQAFTYAYQTEQRQRVADGFQSFVNAVDSSLSQQQRWFELQAFYELLTSIDLSGPVYDWRLANLYLQTGDKLLARDLLLQLQDGGNYLREIGSLLAALEQEGSLGNIASTQEAIALIRKGNHYLVRVILDNNTEATLMIDTGASITSLSADSFSRLSQTSNLDYLGSRLFNTANGVTQGDVYSAASLSLGNQQLSDINIAVLNYQASPGVDGLLGMNVLQNFRFEIDQDNQQLLLSPR